jgi:hypothetical protein
MGKFNAEFCIRIKMQTHVCQSVEEKMKGMQMLKKYLPRKCYMHKMECQ